MTAAATIDYQGFGEQIVHSRRMSYPDVIRRGQSTPVTYVPGRFVQRTREDYIDEMVELTISKMAKDLSAGGDVPGIEQKYLNFIPVIGEWLLNSLERADSEEVASNQAEFEEKLAGFERELAYAIKGSDELLRDAVIEARPFMDPAPGSNQDAAELANKILNGVVLYRLLWGLLASTVVTHNVKLTEDQRAYLVKAVWDSAHAGSGVCYIMLPEAPSEPLFDQEPETVPPLTDEDRAWLTAAAEDRIEH